MSGISEVVAALEPKLEGRVTDSEHAAFKIAQAGDKYAAGGGLDLESFLRDHPQFVLEPGAPIPKRGPAPISSGGSNSFAKQDMNERLRAGLRRESTLW